MKAIEDDGTLTSEKLERYSEADQDAREAERAAQALIETSVWRAKLSDWRDPCYPAGGAMTRLLEANELCELDDGERELFAIRDFDPEERNQFLELKKRKINAYLIQTEILEAVATRMESTLYANTKEK
jgi:hypothetical protein